MGLESSEDRLKIAPLAATNTGEDPTIAPKSVPLMIDAFRQGLLNKADVDSLYDKISGTFGARKKVEKAGLKNILAEQEQVAPLEIQAKKQALQGSIDLQPKAQQVAGGALDQQLFQQQTQNQLNPTHAGILLDKARSDLEDIRSHGNNSTIQEMLKQTGLLMPLKPDGSEDWDKARQLADGVAAMRYTTAQQLALQKGITLKEGTSPDPDHPGATITTMLPMNSLGDVLDKSKQAYVPWSDLKAGHVTPPVTNPPVAPPPKSGTTPQVGKTDAAGHTIVGYASGPENMPSKLREEMERDPRIQEYSKASPAYEGLLIDEKELADKTRQGPGALKAFDVKLGFHYFKLLHPDTRVTEQNFEELEHISPNALGEDGHALGTSSVNAVKDFWNKFTNQTVATPEGRKGIISAGKGAFQAYVNSAAPVLEGYAAQAKRVGLKEEDVILPQWQSLRQKAGAVSPAMPAPAPAPGTGETKTYAGKAWTLGQQYRFSSGMRTVTGFDSTGRPTFGN